ncbi:MAG: TIM barrel protein [Bdellovibrio sp.]
MRLAISNFAWNPAEDLEIFELLRSYEIDAIDVAPGKYFLNPKETKSEEIWRVRSWWNERGIEITGMQSLLFGTSGLNMFGEVSIQNRMLEHLKSICRIGAGLGATRLVFGSPKNRDRSGLSDEQAQSRAVDFFRSLGDIAADFGVIVCLEPNPQRYGANFMLSSVETLQVVKAVDHKAIRMQFDTGALTLNGESPDDILSRVADWVGHVHASEPDLKPLGDLDTDHGQIGKAVARHLPDHLVSIEMLATSEEPHVQSIQRALICAKRFYNSAREI